MLSDFLPHMKKRFLFAFFALTALLTACQNDQGAGKVSADHINPENPPVMTFKDTVINFGTISQGQYVKHFFEFTNTGKSELVIRSVRGSCGCTVPQNWPHDPVKPGESGKIEVQFNSEYKKGSQNVIVTVLANTVPVKNEVYLRGEVAVPDEN